MKMPSRSLPEALLLGEPLRVPGPTWIKCTILLSRVPHLSTPASEARGFLYPLLHPPLALEGFLILLIDLK